MRLPALLVVAAWAGIVTTAQAQDSERAKVTLSLGVAAVWRTEVDPGALFAVRWGPPEGLGYSVELGFTPSSGAGIAVQEVSASVGAGYRWKLRRRVHLELGARVGVLSQSYVLSDPQAPAPTGSVTASLFQAPLELVSALSEKTALVFRLAPGASNARLSHLPAVGDTWTRSLFRIEGAILLQHTF